MSIDPATSRPRSSDAKGIAILIAGMLPVVVGLHLVAGPVVALATLALFTAALVLSLVAQRNGEPGSRDIETGLPDRRATIRRLEEIAAQRTTPKRQAALAVVAFPPDAFATAEDRRAALVIAALRMAEKLRKGDQIVRIGPASLAVILAPSAGLDARSAGDILRRLEGVLREPLRLGETKSETEAEVGLGACLQNDAPGPSGRAWLEAAEQAAGLAAAQREPHVYWLAPGTGHPREWSGETRDEQRAAESA